MINVTKNFKWSNENCEECSWDFLCKFLHEVWEGDIEAKDWLVQGIKTYFMQKWEWQQNSPNSNNHVIRIHHRKYRKTVTHVIRDQMKAL